MPRSIDLACRPDEKFVLGSCFCPSLSCAVSDISPQTSTSTGCSVAEWLECWTQAQKGLGSNQSLRQTVHTHRAAVHQTAKAVAALLRVVRVTAGLAESNGSLSSGL